MRFSSDCCGHHARIKALEGDTDLLRLFRVGSHYERVSDLLDGVFVRDERGQGNRGL